MGETVVGALVGALYGEKQRHEAKMEAQKRQAYEKWKTLYSPFTGGKMGEQIEQDPGKDKPLLGLLAGAKLGSQLGDWRGEEAQPQAEPDGSGEDYTGMLDSLMGGSQGKETSLYGKDSENIA